jgi:2-amino-4-hydroxy-6-hydroxymethyldihydropteridine diphosphokinase
MSKVFVALGSNLQDPILQVKNAFFALEKIPKTTLIKASSLYLSEPLGYTNQPDFINAVAELNTQLEPEALLNALHAIENEAGRERTFANAPRVLDCDLLLYDNVTMHSAKLTLPHPRMHERAFVLLPLAEIAPNLTLENHGNVVKLALQFKNQGIKRLEKI